MVTTLLHSGLLPLHINVASRAAADGAWTRILGNALDAPTESAFRHMFSETECLERRDFTVLHKIAYGLADVDPEPLLRTSTRDLNARDCNGHTPLSPAAERADRGGLVTLLLERGADYALPSRSGKCPLHFAATCVAPDNLDRLLRAGAAVDPRTDWEQTPLHFVAAYTKDERHAQRLVAAGAVVDARDRDGLTPLSWAAAMGNVPVTRALVAAGADPWISDDSGMSPLAAALDGDHAEIVRAMLESRRRGDAHESRPAVASLLAARVSPRVLRALRGLDLGADSADRVDEAEWARDMRQAGRADDLPEMLGALRALGLLRCTNQDDDEGHAEAWEDALEELEPAGVPGSLGGLASLLPSTARSVACEA